MTRRFMQSAEPLATTPIPANFTPATGAGSTVPATSIRPEMRPTQGLAPQTSPRPELRPDTLGEQGLNQSLRPQPRPDSITQAAANDAAQSGSGDAECLTGNCPDCDLSTPEQLGTIFTGATDQELSDLAEGLNFNITDGKIDSHLRISHFLGQVKEEVTANITLRESLYYTTAARLRAVFSHFRRNPAEADRVVQINGREEAIANIVYMDVNRLPGYELGNTVPGDGWRYRGRGLKQLTGRDNYRSFTRGHKTIWSEDIDFEANPDLVSEPKYSVRSGLWFWVSRNCHTLADGGMTRAVSESITDQINRGIGSGSRTNRWNFSNQIHGSDVLKETCWNRSWVNANSKARLPASGGPR